LRTVIKCNALYAYRKESMKKLKDIISDIDESVWKILSNDFNLLTNVILSIYVPVSNLALIPPRRTSFMLFWTAAQILWMVPMDKIAVSQKAND
jgi:hypothetical protein